MADDVYKLYLGDLGYLLRDEGIKARQRRDAVRGQDAEAFETGYLMGFHRVISLMQQQAEAFNIPLTDLRLDGLDPYRDLL